MKSNATFGDKVEIHLTHKIWEGILLEVPEDEKGIVLLKLANGYNIGFKRKDIQEIKLIKKSKEMSKDEKALPLGKNKPNIAMIITGGTIASKYDTKTGGVKWLSEPKELFKFYPEIFDICNIKKIEVPFMKGSEDMDFLD
jgi:glutamyl-tRNA(Gln) amidotransferase subunit D